MQFQIASESAANNQYIYVLPICWQNLPIHLCIARLLPKFEQYIYVLPVWWRQMINTFVFCPFFGEKWAKQICLAHLVAKNE